ncbi:MAG: hypothetical protein J6K94_02955 [Ruminiclostridium sp.]|nr:hypothetical protein [Ruminiclostridium sp.]
MKKKLLSLSLSLVLALGLTIPAGAALGEPETLSASGNFAAVVDEKGTLYTWGTNNYGQLGSDNQANSEDENGTPEQTVPLAVLEDVKAVALGNFHGAAIKTDGTLWTWGCNDNGQVGKKKVNDKEVLWYWTFIIPHRLVTPYQSVPVQIMEDVAKVSAGDYFTAAVKTDGTLWAWGSNWEGELGTNHEKDQNNKIGTPCRKEPTLVMEDVADVACGSFHTLILKTDGTLWACGNNNSGQLGVVDTSDQAAPVQVMTDVAAISAGSGFSAAIKTDGTLWTWGDNQYGQLGTGDTRTRYEPTQVMEGVAQVSLGAYQTAVIKTDETLWTWGWDRFNQLGTGQPLVEGDAQRYTTEPAQVMEDAALASCGTWSTLAAKTDGTLWTWGSDIGSNLGTDGKGDLTNENGDAVQSVPVMLEGLKVKLP